MFDADIISFQPNRIDTICGGFASSEIMFIIQDMTYFSSRIPSIFCDNTFCIILLKNIAKRL
ncbi:MAG: hypothetical protein KKD50_10560, partial [Proteobacteria bacterium]|nr:hypothetical protein [Pseudomonadota bacterium]